MKFLITNVGIVSYGIIGYNNVEGIIKFEKKEILEDRGSRRIFRLFQ